MLLLLAAALPAPSPQSRLHALNAEIDALLQWESPAEPLLERMEDGGGDGGGTDDDSTRDMGPRHEEAMVAWVDLHICRAIPLLERRFEHCAYSDYGYDRCFEASMHNDEDYVTPKGLAAWDTSTRWLCCRDWQTRTFASIGFGSKT